MERKDQISGIFLLIISLLIIQQSISMGVGAFRFPGPGLFPLIWGVALAILSGVILIRASLRARENAKEMRLAVNWSSFGRLGVVIAVLFAFRFAFPHLGFFFSSFLVLIFLFQDPQRKGGVAPLLIPLFAAIMTVMVGYIIFYVLLTIQFPRGPWGIM